MCEAESEDEQRREHDREVLGNKTVTEVLRTKSGTRYVLSRAVPSEPLLSAKYHHLLAYTPRLSPEIYPLEAYVEDYESAVLEHLRQDAKTRLRAV